MTPWEEIKSRHKRNLTAAGEYLVAKCQEKISTPNFDGKNPSAPGDPPHLVTGELQESIGYVVVGDGLQLTASAEHGAYLEFGTSKLAARPFLRPTMQEEAGKVLEILASNG